MKRDACGFIFPHLFSFCTEREGGGFSPLENHFSDLCPLQKEKLSSIPCTHTRIDKHSNSHFGWRTYLGRVDGDHRTEGTLSFAVVSANLDMKWRERRDAVVSVDVARGAGGGCGDVGPANFSEGAEGNDVTEAFAILQFFRDRLRVKHKTIVILKHIQTTHVQPAAGLTATLLARVALKKKVCDLQIAFATPLVK